MTEVVHRAFRCGVKRDAAAEPFERSVSGRLDFVTRFTNCRVLRAHSLRHEDLWVCGGLVVDPQVYFWEHRVADAVIDCEGHIIAPGYIDLQFNGAFGCDFSTPKDLGASVKKVAEGVLPHGVTAFLATVITSSAETYRAVLPHLVPTKGSVRGASLLGVHLEGPFISEQKAGCHPPEHILAPDGKADALRRAVGESVAHVRMVTLAPEYEHAAPLIGELRARGAVVAAGHSCATIEELEASRRVGVSMVTHLFNAMPAFTPREPGLVGLLGSSSLKGDGSAPRAWFGLIADGIHVHPASVNIASNAQPDSVVLVTDAMAAMGLPDGKHRFGDVEVDVRGERAYKAGTDTLAGATVPLDACVRRYAKFAGCGVVRALESASLHPAQCLGIDGSKGRLDVGCDADLILVDDALVVRATYVAGELAWKAP